MHVLFHYLIDFFLRHNLQFDSKHLDLRISDFRGAEAEALNLSLHKQLHDVLLILRVAKVHLELLLDVHDAVAEFFEKSSEIRDGLRINQE